MQTCATTMWGWYLYSLQLYWYLWYLLNEIQQYHINTKHTIYFITAQISGLVRVNNHCFLNSYTTNTAHIIVMRQTVLEACSTFTCVHTATWQANSTWMCLHSAPRAGKWIFLKVIGHLREIFTPVCWMLSTLLLRNHLLTAGEQQAYVQCNKPWEEHD